MLMHLKCPCCGKPLKVAEEFAGKKGKCPGCLRHFLIPVAQSPTHAGTPHHDALTIEEVHDHDHVAYGASHESHPLGEYQQPKQANPSSTGSSWWKVVCGILIFFGLLGRCGFIGAPASKVRPADNDIPVEQRLLALMQASLEHNKQNIFNQLHPVGTAKRVVVHDVTVTAWKHGRKTDRLDDIRQCTTRYTIYWEGPINKDGYTEVSETFDAEVGRIVAAQILATNGVTNGDAGNAALNLLGGAVEAWLQYQADKETAREYYNGQ